ncbi:hypothetical protein Psuf_085170 [Phytohabitans suffuscus]|uniref:Large ribosomal subunit protein bL36 n=1 Tax=Phytohabitans suffuscus TaxID=624315 RepID=A0A6F8YYR4_9ACTN|nr:hypothetical protein Psuf_085170 [Phytohabitans suffuscus]
MPPIVRYRDVRPGAVVLCAGEDDVGTTLNFAGSAGLLVAVRELRPGGRLPAYPGILRPPSTFRMPATAERPARSGKENVMKVRSSLRSLTRKPGAVVVRRGGRLRVVNRVNPRFNGRQG